MPPFFTHGHVMAELGRAATELASSHPDFSAPELARAYSSVSQA
jgi:hypothetical protein